MSVLDRAALEDSPLADLHALASELGLDGFRRLRKEALIGAILERHGGDAGTLSAAPASGDEEAEPEEAPKRRRSRGGRSRRGRGGADAPDAEVEAEAEETVEADAPRERRAAGGRGGEAPERTAEGVVELLGNGSGFVRVSPPEPSDDDIYISAAQVRRCELVSGDRVSGPVRPPRRSERYPSLVRVDTINDRAADEVAEGTHFDDLPAAFPSQRFALASDDSTVEAISRLTPLGRGSRVTIVGPPRAGKSEALRRVAAALGAEDGLELTLVLTGVRPEEVAEWRQGAIEPAAALTFAASPDAQAQAVDRGAETAKRIAARGGHAVVLVDTLDALASAPARKLLAAARDIPEGGSLTVIATATAPIGGETTVVALDVELTSLRRFPAIDLAASGTLRPELLVGEDGADAIARERASAAA